MGAMASQFTSLTSGYSTVYSGTDQRKYQSFASLAFVRGIHRWTVNSPPKWPVTRKMFPFDDVIVWHRFYFSMRCIYSFVILSFVIIKPVLGFFAFMTLHDDLMKWKHLPCYLLFVRGIQGSSMDSPGKGQWRGALMFSLICPWTNSWGNNWDAGDLRRHRAHYDVIVVGASGIWIIAPAPSN